MAKAKTNKRIVIVTTERRGVFFGTLVSYDEPKRVAVLQDAKMAIYFGTTKGLFQLADTGPTSSSKISAPAKSIRLELCECVIDVTDAAAAVWAKA